MESFTTLAQAPASVLSDLPAKQAQSMAASAPGLSLPMAGLLAVGAVIAGVAGGSSGSEGTPVDPAQKQLDDKIDTIKLGLKVDSGLESKDGVTKNGALELKDATSGITLATEPTGLEFSKDGGKTWESSLSGLAPGEGANSVILRLQGDKGLVSKSSSPLTFTIDTKAPLASQIKAELVHDKTNDDGVSENDGITSNQSPFLSGTAEAGSIVAVSFDGVKDSFVSPTVVGADGKWSLQVKLSPGTWTPVVKATDAAGNVSDPASGTAFTIKQAMTAEPVMTAELKRDAINDTGISAMA